MKPFFLFAALLLALGGCASPPTADAPAQAVIDSADKLSMFSQAGSEVMPRGWEPMVIFKHKKPTRYEVVMGDGSTVLHAYAANASSGLMQHVNLDPMANPLLRWTWKIGKLDDRIAQAQDLMEDAPARIILGFDGDKDKLPFSEQILFETAKLLTGYDFPYATLMYEWHGKRPVGSITPSKRSSRIQTVVVESGAEHVGQWREFSRNIVEDFQKAYGEAPGRLIGIGVLTDSDFTGQTVESWYGDIRLLPRDTQIAVSCKQETRAQQKDAAALPRC